MKEHLFLPLDLQLFAENVEGEENPTPAEADKTPTEPKTFTQDELDKIVADRIARERKKFDKFADYDDLKTKAFEYEQELEKKRLAELSAQERAEELAKKYEAERNDYANKLQEYQAKVEREQKVNAFIKAAPSVNIPADRIDAALKLADLSAVTVGEDGVEGLADVMKTLVEQYSFLADVKKPQKPIGEATNNSNEVVEKTAEQLLRDAAEKVKRTGKIEDQIAYAALKNKLGK